MNSKQEENLIEKFNTISKSGWIKGINNSSNGAGLTFESLLNKRPDSEFFPDYNGIDLKCTSRFSRFPISLFSLSFDGPSVFEMNRILEKYGKNDIIYKDKKILITTMKIGKYSLVNNKYYFQLILDEFEERLYIYIYDLDYKLIEKASYIDFDTIKSRLEIKLSKIALIFNSKKIINDSMNYRYYHIIIYYLKSFDKFLELLRNGEIIVSLQGRISRSGLTSGKQKNKNMVFQINKDSIDKLFEKKYEYNHDNH